MFSNPKPTITFSRRPLTKTFALGINPLPLLYASLPASLLSDFSSCSAPQLLLVSS